MGTLVGAGDGSAVVGIAVVGLGVGLCDGSGDGLGVGRGVGSGVGRADGDSVGTYICTDLSCHDNVRLAAPLAPSEMRGSVDLKIDGTRRRTEAFVARVLENGEAPA